MCIAPLSTSIVADSRAMTTRLLVSIHDVTPLFENEVQQLWDWCGESGFTPALLVVPNWHGAWPLHDHPRQVEWLQKRVAENAEIILHGERHDEYGLARTIFDSLRALGRTSREGEFLTLGYGDARDRIQRGLAVLRSLSLEPQGFVPPAWLARNATFAAARDADLAFSEDAGSIRVHSTNQRIHAPVIRWSARTSWRAHMSSAVAKTARSLHAGKPIVRVALHPQDLAHPAAARSVQRELQFWAQCGKQVRYDSL